MGESLFARTGPAGQALSPLSPEGKGDLGESGGAPLQGKRGRGSFRKKKTTSYDFLKKNFLVQWTGHCTAGISKSIISNDLKNEEAGHGPVPCPGLILITLACQYLKSFNDSALSLFC